MLSNKCTRLIVTFILTAILLPIVASARFISVDPKASKYPSVSPYVYTLNNPLKYIDPNGQELELTGQQKDIDQTVQVANDGMGPVGTATVDNSGVVTVSANDNFVGPVLPEQQAMFNTMSAAADPNSPCVSIDVTNGSNQVLVGSYVLQQIDIADIQQFGNGGVATSAGALGHEVAEQMAKQVSGVSDYSAHHQLGITAENAINGSVRGQGTSSLNRTASGLSGSLSIPFTRNGMTKTLTLKINNTNITSVSQ